MTCPVKIADVLLEILQNALLVIRASGWNDDAARCAHHADHVHNLPSLLADYTPDRLRYYWDVERKAFVKQSDLASIASYTPMWERLAPLLPPVSGSFAQEPKPQTAAVMAAVSPPPRG
jgi:hypothetical protein